MMLPVHACILFIFHTPVNRRRIAVSTIGSWGVSRWLIVCMIYEFYEPLCRVPELPLGLFCSAQVERALSQDLASPFF